MIQETTEKIVLIKQRIQAAQDRQKSYAVLKRKPMSLKLGIWLCSRSYLRKGLYDLVSGGPEFTWEHEDSFKEKYPHLFTNRTSSSTTRS
ncbi:hypothetical protein Tco_0023480 [Tanacetum coccineum]